MESSVAKRPAVRSAFAKLIDYAGLFPPAKLALAQAADEYRNAHAGEHAWMLGRFIIPAPLLADSPAVPAGPFSAIVEPDREALGKAAALRAGGVAIEVLEIPLRGTRALDALRALVADIAAAGIGDLPAFVELPRGAGRREELPLAMALCAGAGLGAKLRCGGLTADAFPSVDEVAEFILAAQEERVPFKATAGLHHPVRHVDPATGFTMHGFLNVLTAAALAPRADAATVRRILAEEAAGAFVFEPAALRWRTERITLEELVTARRERFVSYGSCSFTEPVEDLTALGVLPA